REDCVGAGIFIIEKSLADPANTQMTDNNSLKTTNHTPALVYNLTAPNPVANHTFTKALGSWLNRPTYLTLPEVLLKLRFGEFSTLLIDG
ncbi:TIGR01777 family protein, partial [Psychrobacter sp. FBL11]